MVYPEIQIKRCDMQLGSPSVKSYTLTVNEHFSEIIMCTYCRHNPQNINFTEASRWLHCTYYEHLYRLHDLLHRPQITSVSQRLFIKWVDIRLFWRNIIIIFSIIAVIFYITFYNLKKLIINFILKYKQE